KARCAETQIAFPTRVACEKCRASYIARVTPGLMDCRFLIPSYELAEGGRAEGISRVQGRHLFDEEDAIPRVTCIAMVRQRAEGRVVAEETEDQGVAFREGWVDRCAAVERGGMEHDHVPGLRRPRSNFVSVRVELALSLDVGKARQGAASMQGLGRIV